MQHSERRVTSARDPTATHRTARGHRERSTVEKDIDAVILTADSQTRNRMLPDA